MNIFNKQKRLYKLSLLFRPAGRLVKTHKVDPASGNEHTDIEIKDDVVLPRGEDNPIPPHTLIMDVTIVINPSTHRLIHVSVPDTFSSCEKKTTSVF